MASLNVVDFGVATTTTRGRVFKVKVSKSSGNVEEEKGLLDWILGGLQKQDQLLETDPVLNKVEEEKSRTVGSRKSTASVSMPSKKKFGGFGGLFAKN